MEKKKPNVIFQENKKSGTVYAYEDHPYWDSEKKQSRSNRECVGKIDPSTGEIVPTRHRKSNTDNKKQRIENSIAVGDKAKIGTGDILWSLEEKITGGLQSGAYSLTDISMLISSAVEEVKKKIISDVEKILNEEEKSEDFTSCDSCGEALKKTTKKTRPKG